MQFILYLLLAWIAYNFIFKLVIPVYLTTRKIKKTFRQMQTDMQEQQSHQQQGFTGTANSSPKPQQQQQKPTLGDYIDFEEVK